MNPFVRRRSIRHTDRTLARAVFALVLAVYTATFCGVPDTPGGEIAFQTSSALARHGSLAIGGTPEAEILIAHAQDDSSATLLREGIGEGTFASSGIGHAVTGVPFYWVGRILALVRPSIQELHESRSYWGAPRSEYFEHLVAGWRNALFTALTCWLLVLSARRLGLERRHAWLGGVTYGIATFAWSQARSTLPDVQATLLVFLAFHLILQVRERYDRLDTPHRRTLAGIGLALGCALLTRVSLLPICIVLLAAAETVVGSGSRRIAASRWSPKGPLGTGRMRALAFLLVPFIACMGLHLALDQWRFGVFFVGDEVLGAGFLDHPMPTGVAGLLVAPGKGLLWMAPALLLLPWGIAAARARGETLWLLVTTGVFIGVLLPAATSASWHGAWTYGPRFLLPALPFLWLGVTFALKAVEERRHLRVLAVGLFCLGVLVQIPAALVDHATHEDLAQQAARLAWPTAEGRDEDAAEAERFDRIQWDWGFAAPWAHWRILRHRLAPFDDPDRRERFPVREIFHVDAEAVITPTLGRDIEFRHLAWVDQVRRLDMSVWPPALIVSMLLLVGTVLSFRGLDRSAP